MPLIHTERAEKDKTTMIPLCFTVPFWVFALAASFFYSSKNFDVFRR
jgi:hypothetical protein